MVCYRTKLGEAHCGDSLQLIKSEIEDNTVDLVLTSPPFALLQPKEYGNENQENYMDWFCEFGRLIMPKLKDTGSFVVDIGASFNKGEPTYNLYQFRTLLKLCDEVGYKLAQPFYFHNTSALPSPIEYVSKKKIRCKNSVNTVWWLSKTAYPKADVRNILNPYSKSMKKIIKKPSILYSKKAVKENRTKVSMKKTWSKNNGGSIPSNALLFSNAESNSAYLRKCRQLNIKKHPARFPRALPDFFIKFLTDENDLVVDIFSGSNTTGYEAEKLKRRWKSFELNREYVASSVLRFVEKPEDAEWVYNRVMEGEIVNFI